MLTPTRHSTNKQTTNSQSESSILARHLGEGLSPADSYCNLVPASALRRKVSSALNLAAGGLAGVAGVASAGPSSGASSKRNSCNCRKCSIFSLEDCEPKEVSSVIKYLRFRKVNTTALAKNRQLMFIFSLKKIKCN